MLWSHGLCIFGVVATLSSQLGVGFVTVLSCWLGIPDVDTLPSNALTTGAIAAYWVPHSRTDACSATLGTREVLLDMQGSEP